MAIKSDAGQAETVTQQRPFAHLRATPQERERIVAAAAPFDIERWQRDTVPPTPEELVDLEEFLREREAMRRDSLEQEQQRSAESPE